MSKQKIAVMGGGLSALSTIYYLTNQDGWKDHYDITVYQMGWRLGGKLASGSDAAKNFRIEDTGVHFCMGFYENFFKMIRDCYAKFYNDPEFWREQFIPYDSLDFMDYHNNQWKPWTLTPPSLRADKSPGDGLPILDLWEHLLEFIHQLNDHYLKVFFQQVDARIEAVMPDSVWRRMLLAAVNLIQRLLKRLVNSVMAEDVSKKAQSPGDAGALPNEFFKLPKPTSPDDPIIKTIQKFIQTVLDFIQKIEKDIEKKEEAVTDEFRHAWMLLKFGVVMLHGIIGDDVLFKGFRQLDEQEFSGWLRKWGADDALIASPLITGLYEGVFAYEDGDLTKPRIAAGVALYTMLRQFLFHNGSLIYRMNNSTGMAFTPLYRELYKRGVKFEFFQRIKSLNLSTDPATPNHVDSITIERQVTLITGTYSPLLFNNDEKQRNYFYWPTIPRVEQIVREQAKILEAAAQEGPLAWARVNLEYYSSSSLVPEAERTYTLKANDDYDIILLAIPIGVLPYVCPGFGDVNPKWDAMVKNLKTVSTQGMQLWFMPTLADMGWAGADHPITATYKPPFSAWGDMYQLLTQEEKNQGIQTAIHFAAVLMNLEHQPPPDKLTAEDHIKASDYVRRSAVNWLNSEVQPLWPNATDPANPKGVDWNKLYVFHPEWKGEQRFDDQYWGASIDPSIRYDRSLPKTLQYRLKPGDSGFDNVVLAGTWTDNGLNVSLMESATMSGMMAASVISEKVTGTAYPGFDSIAGVMDYDFK